MIFAELQYPGHYSDHHEDLLDWLAQHFSQVEAGHQGDSWIWILDGGGKVAIDTFTSMKHQVKAAAPGPHVQNVLAALRRNYRLNVYDPPEPEGHEDGQP